MNKKPSKLNKWDTVLALSLSWGWPWLIPDRYNIWKYQLEQEFWVNVIEGKYTMADPKRLYEHPEARAEDLMEWFKNKEIKAIVSTIGWEESIRMLPYIDYNIIANNPKIFMWYSDTTISHFICQKAGIVSFYWPAIMAWFWENWWLFPYMIESVRKTIFSNKIIWEIYPNMEWRTSEFLSREKWNQNIKRKLKPSTWRRWLQWKWVVNWTLLWWCIDVFPFMIWTNIRPEKEKRKNKILFLEPSEEKMNTTQFERIVRNLWSQWILHNIIWILVWRPQYDYKNNIQIDYDDILIKIVSKEFWLTDLAIITNMDFWHTDPMFVLPVGCEWKIDCEQKKFFISENACI